MNQEAGYEIVVERIHRVEHLPSFLVVKGFRYVPSYFPQVYEYDYPVSLTHSIFIPRVFGGYL